MSREKKRGTSGNARAFITRAKALRKLQLSLEEFRRLCIVKGIYPRDPKKKVDGTDKMYYLRKDIEFLAHDRLIGVLRRSNAHKKKVTKARARRERDQLRQLALSTPKARLDHVVLERYPTFNDALKELDDPLCVIGLFANMPSNTKFGIPGYKVNLCKRLLNEFHHIIVVSGALRKSFVSIKGYYYQAVLNGEVITWMTPHRFTQVLPKDVDYSVMLTFLDLYKCILSFVNYRLYASKNLAYPPKFSRALLNTALELGAVVEADTKVSTVAKNDDTVVKQVPNEKRALVAKMAADMAKHDEDDESDGDEEVEEEQETEDDSQRLTMFKGCSVIIGRETPFNELDFVLRAAGVDKITREDDLPPEHEDNRLDGYTHWIIDRPQVRGVQAMNLEYVQPQYVFDCINTGMKLPTSLYGVGRKLPPHLSPFVAEDADGGYRPWYKDILERIKKGDESVVAEAAAVIYEQEKAQRETEEEENDEMDVVEKPVDDQQEKVVEKTEVKAKSKKKRKRSKGKKQATEDNTAVEEEPQSKKAKKTGESEVPEKENEAMKDAENSAQDDDDEMKVDEAETRGSEPEEVERMKDEVESEASEADEDDDEEDSEGEEEEKEDDKENVANNEKDLVRVMLSRKKMRKYQHIVREQEEQKALKDKLTAKRKALEEKTASKKGKSRGRKNKNVKISA